MQDLEIQWTATMLIMMLLGLCGGHYLVKVSLRRLGLPKFFDWEVSFLARVCYGLAAVGMAALVLVLIGNLKISTPLESLIVLLVVTLGVVGYWAVVHIAVALIAGVPDFHGKAPKSVARSGSHAIEAP